MTQCRGDINFWSMQVSVAEKIRAAISNYYEELTDNPTAEFAFDSQQQKWIGNPCKSKKVRQYIRSLKHRKARAGEKAKSMCAITQEDFMSLYSRCDKTKDAVIARQYMSTK